MKLSVKAKRMERHHKRYGKGGLNLVSLMDIFTILVFFLLVNSSNVEQLPSSKAITLPESKAERLPEETLLILINNDDLIVQGRKIASAEQIINSEDNVIPALKAELELQLQNRLGLTQDLEDTGEVTIMGDKEIPYKLLKRILYTLSASNYKNISLAVSKAAKDKPEGASTP
ncbi:biopolymer transporter ExbD [Pleionea sp. CnH1-48]|uniref:ExbD/TolR family protein n=1 Tax=Pleionea sp. CnH1-48 TaxID=2954494 RepID=UPI002097B6DA|nr:biopolymer transporter ExbD [Pleionea sp. CnH1-48]MCO7223065.1 biopolymer transporter ExbD [Pleionea sp. CnH1-48]